ncbi:hypothetical protein O3M35_011076 [Rhynocoris fuscipes]|uniref:Cell cycle checkpoint control protein RAD9A n=1 Tax=Rhynocoris fuscipes TaxID=488301 RepID=A0AAW1CV96_9HEMI
MKCIIPNQNVKIIARAILSLSKIGDELFIEPTSEEISFRTVNMAQSAFAEFKINHSFFSSYSYNDPDDSESMCKVTMRSCLNIFKNIHNMDKQVENCEIRMKPEATVVIFQMKFTNAPVKKYYLPIIDSEKLEANIPTESQNRLTASSKMLTSTIKNFRYSEDEITLTVDKDKALIKNHIELRKDVHSMRTELCFHPSEFENYTVNNPACITFCFKELRAVLAFAEPSNLSVGMSFSSPGMPILFQVQNVPVYEASYVVSTLNANVANLEMSLTRHSRTVNQPQRSSVNEPANPFSFVDENDEYNIQQHSESERPLAHSRVNDVDNINRSSRIECNQEQSNNVNNEVPRLQKSLKRKSSVEIHSTLPLSDGIESVYSTFKTGSTIVTEKTNSPAPSEPPVTALNSDYPSDLVRLVFARCFIQNNVHRNKASNEVVIAAASDDETV